MRKFAFYSILSLFNRKEKSIAILSNPDSLRSDNITKNMKTGEEEQDSFVVSQENGGADH